ncbi:MAG: CPBP family intramembrane metalloprotease [Thaumarchaeota archaeon]|nr:CPBP family intramembrane metalloprotease [Nitrososphaerota archaeon]
MSDLAPPAPTRDWFQVTLVVAFLFLLTLTAYLVILSFPAGVYAVFFTHLSNTSSAVTVVHWYLWIGPIAVTTPFPASLGAIFLAMTAVYVAMFVYAAKQGRSIPSSLVSAVREDILSVFSNRALLTLVSIAFLLYTANTLDSFVEATGSSIGDPFTHADPLWTLVGFSVAPIREEFGFRVMLVGVAAVLVSRASARAALKSLWRPSASFMSGGAVAMYAVWGVAVGSSLLFGACHVGIGCGGGWDLGKLPEATYGGLFLAFLYVRYGFHVAVLVHWGVDYLTSVFAFFGQGAAGVPWLSGNAYALQELLVLDVFQFFGIATFLLVIYAGIRKVQDRRKIKSAPLGPVALAS